jgi:hypothetical protein
LNHLGESEQNPTVVGVDVRTAPLATDPWVRSYGVVNGGFEVIRAAWPKLEQFFSVRRSNKKMSDEGKSPEPKYVFKEPHRLPNNLLNDFPVDLLIIEQGADTRPTPDYERKTWEKLIYRTQESNKPRIVIESWPPNAPLWTKGPACKSTVARWHDMDYVSRFKRISMSEQETFFWKPPDLREGHEWHQKRLANLQKAAESFPDPTSVIEEGIQALHTHRNNYTNDSPEAKKLQLLWWEFPREHWQPLREGSHMNFLCEPKAAIHENATMDEEQARVAGELFVVPKEGQEGQWRVIADML